MDSIFLNIYNLSASNFLFGACGLGIYHSSVEIEGKEYSFGPNLGISILPINSIKLDLHEKILIGTCDRSSTELEYLISQLREKFTKNDYHYLSYNCNTFTNELLNITSDYDLPDYVNRIPRFFQKIPFLKNTNRYMCGMHNFIKKPKYDYENEIINDDDFEIIDIESNSLLHNNY